MTRDEEIDFLIELVENTGETVSRDDYNVMTQSLQNAWAVARPLLGYSGISIIIDEMEVDDPPEHVLDLFYIRKDDIGHVVRAVRREDGDYPEQNMYFYAHTRILGLLMLYGGI